MLKTIRIILAIVSIFLVTLLFIDFTGTAQSLWPWMAKIQFMPALLSFNVLALILILGGTLLFGRIYCSIVCPLGILQDIANWARGKIGTKKKRLNRFKYTLPHTKLRLTVLTVFFLLLILGLANVLASVIAGLIEPYSAYGRIASQIFAPIYDIVNNILANWSESQIDNYTFYRVTAVVTLPILIIASVTLVVIIIMAWQGGRDYCNTVCPVGTCLGYLSKYSILKPVINTDKCINCGLCARNCKSKCIDARNHNIDYTRCVACMDCIEKCKESAISYTWRSHKSSDPFVTKSGDEQAKGRRGFIVTSSLIIGGLAIDAMPLADGGLTPLKPKKSAKRREDLVPAGAISQKHLSQHCTGCQLCIQNCPNKVLKPNLSLDKLMQPSMDFTNGYCRPDCTLCSNICPTGAFHPISEIEKSSIKIGTAVVDLDACLSATQGENCEACVSNCPAGAIIKVPKSEGSQNLMPTVDTELCIGCGACEYHCPVGTLASMDASGSAIHVEGIKIHREI